MDRLGIPRTHILGYTMPGFATSDATRNNAHGLMKALGISAKEIDIRPACLQVFKDIEHPFAGGEKVYDVTFENVQAGQRTAHLFRLANFHKAIVLGTGDLSELALGWSTYGVGDQMSHYNVNGSVPKTLIHHLIRWVVKTGRFSGETDDVLTAIAGHGNFSGTGTRRKWRSGGTFTENRIRHWSLCASGFQPLLYHPVRISSQQGGVSELLCLGETGTAGPGRESCRRPKGINMICPPSRDGLRYFSIVFSKPVSSKDPRFPMVPRWALEGPFLPVETGGRPAIRKPPYGSTSCIKMFPIKGTLNGEI